MKMLRAVLAEAPLAWLLFAVPVAAVMHHLRPQSALLVFVLACVAIVPLAGLLGLATEKLAARTGEAIGGFLNATLGNAAELIIALVALRAGMLDVVKASLTGSIIGNLLLVLGAAFLAGGLRHPIQTFATIGVRLQVGMMALAAVGHPRAVDLHHDRQERTRRQVDGLQRDRVGDPAGGLSGEPGVHAASPTPICSGAAMPYRMANSTARPGRFPWPSA